jgi:hypothetical protein
MQQAVFFLSTELNLLIAVIKKTRKTKSQQPKRSLSVSYAVNTKYAVMHPGGKDSPGTFPVHQRTHQSSPIQGVSPPKQEPEIQGITRLVLMPEIHRLHLRH